MNYFKCKGESYKVNDYTLDDRDLRFVVEKAGTLEQLLSLIGEADIYEFGLLDDENVGMIFSTEYYYFVSAEEVKGEFIIRYEMPLHMTTTKEDQTQSKLDYLAIMAGIDIDEV